MKIGLKSPILQNADVFKTALLSVTIVSDLPKSVPALVSISATAELPVIEC
jgi:hypothetical protein